MESIHVAIEVKIVPYHNRRNSRCCKAAKAREFSSVCSGADRDGAADGASFGPGGGSLDSSFGKFRIVLVSQEARQHACAKEIFPGHNMHSLRFQQSSAEQALVLLMRIFRGPRFGRRISHLARQTQRHPTQQRDAED
jgi:hypothetical protein